MYAAIGLATKDPETAQIAGILPFFVLMFASNAIVPVATMPGWLQGFAPKPAAQRHRLRRARAARRRRSSTLGLAGTRVGRSHLRRLLHHLDLALPKRDLLTPVECTDSPSASVLKPTFRGDALVSPASPPTLAGADVPPSRVDSTFQPSSAQLLWITDIYGFMLAGFLVLIGSRSDRVGCRRPPPPRRYSRRGGWLCSRRLTTPEPCGAGAGRAGNRRPRSRSEAIHPSMATRLTNIGQPVEHNMNQPNHRPTARHLTGSK
jgi:hypothetical protein